MADFCSLNARHGIASQVVFKEGPGALPVVEIINPQAAATIALQGAQLLTWAPHGERPVIWLSPAAKFAPGKSVRGGIPICWPWFGPHATEPSFPTHGFARTVAWGVIGTQELADGTTRIAFRLTPSDATRALWPHASELELHVTVGQALELELLTRNTGAAPITIGDALHTYFEVGDVRAIAIHGLDGRPYIDKVDGGRRKRQSGAVTIGAETDRVYLDTEDECVIEDPELGRRIRIAKRGSRSTVVWSPWIEKAAKLGDMGDEGYLRMVCVESANAADDAVTIAPGGEHRLWVRYQHEPLA